MTVATHGCGRNRNGTEVAHRTGSERTTGGSPVTCNVGRTDRTVRIIAGLAIVGAGFYFRSWWGAIGVIPITVGALRWCPLFTLLKISTGKRASLSPPAP